MRAERDRRAAILTAEGERQAAILTAEGEKAGGGAARPKARSRRRSCAPRAKRRRSTRSSLRSTRANPTRDLLSYEYLQMLPAAGRRRREQGVRGALRVRTGVRRHRRGAPRPAASSPDGARSRVPTAASGLAAARAGQAPAARHGAARHDVRRALREAAGHARRRAPARHAERADIDRRCARSASRCLRRTSTSRWCGVHSGREAALPGCRSGRQAQPRPAGDQDRRRRAGGIDGGRSPSELRFASKPTHCDPDGGSAGLRQDDSRRQACTLPARGARLLGRARGLRRLPARRCGSAGEGRRAGGRHRLPAGHRKGSGGDRHVGARSGPSRTARTC